MTGYCVKCRAKKEIIDPISHKIKNTKSNNSTVEMLKGRCKDCNTVMYHVTGHG